MPRRPRRRRRDLCLGSSSASNSANQPVRTGRIRRARRNSQEAVAFTELAVLVSASRDEHVAQASAIEIERHDVELVVGVEEQRRAVTATRRANWSSPGTISAVSNSTEDTITQAVRESSVALTRSARVSTGRAGDLDDHDTFFGESIDLTPDAVELAVGGHDARALEERQRGQPPRDQLVRVLAERDVVCDCRRGAARSPRARRRPATAARSHLSSTNSAASSQARCCASNPTSGHAWCEWPVSSSRSPTRNRE